MARNLFENDNKQVTKKVGRNLFSGPEKEETFLQKLPRNIGAGLANLGHSLINAPHDLVKNFQEQGSEWRDEIDKSGLGKYSIPKPKFNASDYIPRQENYNFAEMLGQKGEPTWGDYLIQKGVEHSPEILTAGNALRNTGLIPHLTRRGASRTLSEARGLAEGRNISQLNIDPQLIEDARQFLPNTAPNRNLINAAQHGDYNSLFQLQSDLGKHSGAYAKSMFSAAERSHGQAGMGVRNRLLDEIHTNLQSQGHHDISKLLRQGQNEYRRYMKFKPYRNALALGTFGLAIPRNTITNMVKTYLSNNLE